MKPPTLIAWLCKQSYYRKDNSCFCAFVNGNIFNFTYVLILRINLAVLSLNQTYSPGLERSL